MLLKPGILRGHLALVPPDIRETRHGRHLLVWGDRPHWMVVDGELDAFLGRLDGSASLESVAGAAGLTRRALATMATDLVSRGVLRPAGSPPGAAAGTTEYRLENIAINITSRCNLRCTYCYNHERLRSAPQGELTAEEVARFLYEARPLTARGASLVLLGGEPFLEPEKLLAVAARARRRRMPCLVSTNGTLLTPPLAAEARRAGLQVQVSIDGPDAASHDCVRGRGVFERALAGIRLLVAARVHTIMSMVCHTGNVARLGDFFDLAMSLGVAEARFILLKPLGAAATSALRPVPLSELLRQACDLLKRRLEVRRLLGRDALSIVANTCRYSARRPSCGTGLQTVLLDADGSLYPCLNLNVPEFRIASVRDAGYDFREVWRESPVLQAVRRSTSLENPERACGRCPVRYWCLGGCRGEAHAVAGDVRLPSPACKDLSRTMLDMMWMLADAPDLVPAAVRIC